MSARNENAALIGLIRDQIKKHGPVSFAWFMEQALYHPEHGYYSSGRCSIGRKGDYFTNVSVGPLFGQLLAAQFSEVWEQLGRIDNFVIVEQGAHDGQFARDVLQFVQHRWPEFFGALCYRIIEPFQILREQQSQTLESFRDKIEWPTSLEPFAGIHFSNELLDAMPVRLIAGQMEKFVDLQDDALVFIERPRSNTAFNQTALEWIDGVAGNLERGYVIAIDYGQWGELVQGNIQVRAGHRHLNSPFEQIGRADITMHVEWASIADRASRHGLNVIGFTDQHHFLSGIISTWPELVQDRAANATNADRKSKRALQTLLHPEMLGRAFQVLALEKNIGPGARRLAGFKFARESPSS
ncbi:MAG TPA: SAM-dependent methyltransferase [Candidatus Udaeobacter sp.]|nr:SAM-dependent methyltransferase [Candidatus Udaeobacter sp.]